MRTGTALRLAFGDLYRNSWRLVPVNAALGAVLAVTAFAALAEHVLVVLAILGGPIAMALTHCSVTLVRTGNVELADAREGLRLHWRRGLAFGAAALVLAAMAAFAVRFYTRTSGGWPLAFLTLYIVILLGIYGVVLATVTAVEPNRPLRVIARDAATVGARRPGTALLLGLALLLVNLAGIAAGVMPFLTITVAYSSLAVAHFVVATEEAKEA